MFAADVVAPSFGSHLAELFLSPAGLGLLVSVVVGILGAVLGMNEVRRRRVALAAYHAFHIVEDLAAETETDIDDKIAAGLKALDSYLLANGWRAAKAGEVEVAKLTFASLNGATKVAEKVAEAAAAEAAPSVPPSP